MKNTTKPSFWLLLLAVCMLWSCDFNPEDGIPPLQHDKTFVSATPIGTFSKQSLQALALSSAEYKSFAPLVQYDVSFYRIVYKTMYKGKEIDASGLLAVPQNTPFVPALLSAQHGTMFKRSDAPSNFPSTFSGFELFGAAGYVAVIPDFIGYGASANIFHPYYDETYSADAVVDMLKAAKYYLKREKVKTNGKLFLVGYSEGGYVTLAAQKKLEADPEKDLALTAVAAGAGGYDLTEMMNIIATTPSYADPAFLPFIVQSYNITYNWNRPLTDFFQQPYAAKIPGLFDGTKIREEIDSALPNEPAALFTPTFYAALQKPAEETVLKQALADNSLLDWVPKSPTRLYHGTADEAVFFQTSETTYKAFIAAGAKNVTFIPIPGGMHRTSITPMMLDVLPWFSSFK
ncbi:alpha/beta hydrolase family protein [Pontibacter chitinilyticus]|uniref:alpha/beta hydrolase family protein n=1 Tax=Pontibacter chitinilyticus TaxID=2674989 RepID=UPI00321AE87B